MQPQNPQQSNEPASLTGADPSTPPVTIVPQPQLENHKVVKKYYMGMYMDSEKDYKTVPWYRKTTTVILLCLIIPIVGALIPLTGNVYVFNKKTQQTWEWTKQGRLVVGFLVLASGILFAIRMWSK